VSRAVYVHIGAYKTGTTYLQQKLLANQNGLAAQGTRFPAWRGWGDQVRAFHHVLGRADPHARKNPAEAWRRLVDAVSEWTGERSVLSYEGLSLATEDQVRRVVADLGAGGEVHVVLTARDLVRVIPAMWQEVLQGGQSWTWPQYAETVTSRLGRTVPPGRNFWRAQDLVKVLEPWSAVVPVERIHVVAVPPIGAPPGALWERFCAALGIEPGVAPAEPARINESLDPASAELMRRINVAVEGRLDQAVYDRVLKSIVAKDVLASRAESTRVALTDEQAAWARERGRAMATELQDRGYRIIGSPDDLVGGSPGENEQASPDEVIDLAAHVIEALATRLHSEITSGRRKRRGAEPEGTADGQPSPEPHRTAGSRPASRLVRQAYERLKSR
jgi:hypothetical protein